MWLYTEKTLVLTVTFKEMYLKLNKWVLLNFIWILWKCIYLWQPSDICATWIRSLLKFSDCCCCCCCCCCCSNDGNRLRFYAVLCALFVPWFRRWVLPPSSRWLSTRECSCTRIVKTHQMTIIWTKMLCISATVYFI